MKKLLFLLLLLPLCTLGQGISVPSTNPTTTAIIKGAFVVDTIQILPLRDTVWPSWYPTSLRKRGGIILRTADSLPYFYTGARWVKFVTGTVAGTDSTIFATVYDVDTAKANIYAAISAGSADSSVFATLYRLDTTRSALYAAILLRVKYSDTAAMLAPYLHEVDTTAMLSPYMRKANNLSDVTSVATSRTNLGATTVGGNFFTLTNPGAITFPRINADNSVSALSAAAFRSAIGAGTGDGSVTTVSVATANGLAGTVANATTTPAITLTTSVTGILKGNGTAISAAAAGTDYEVPLTFSTGLTRTTNTITVNTSQNIATLSNLTSNGFVKTSGGVGTLSVDATSYTPTTRTISTTSPITGGGDLSADRTIAINNAAADGTTKGAATFTAADFDASSGLISIDYTNGQAASGAAKGFLTAADWTTFNNKQATIARYLVPAANLTSTITNITDQVPTASALGLSTIKVTATLADATTATIPYGYRMTHTTSGTATTGFGLGEEWELENGSGTNRIAATQEVDYTDAVNATEDAQYKLWLIKAGTLTLALTVSSTGVVTMVNDLTLAGNMNGSGNVRAGAASNIRWSGSTTMTAPADGVLLIQNAALSDVGGIKLGGTTSSFPYLKRSGTSIKVRLADDSGDGDFSAGNFTGTGTTGFVIGNALVDVTGTDAQGDIWYRDGSGIFTRLAPGTANQILHSGTTPVWKDTTAVPSVGTTFFKTSGALSSTLATVTDNAGSPANTALQLSTQRIGILQDAAVTTQTSSVIQATGAGTDINLCLQTKGAGALTVDIPDGTTTGGDSRGTGAVDLSSGRTTSSNRVASGLYSTIGGGYDQYCGNSYATIGGGTTNIASNTGATVGGGSNNTASGQYSTVSGGLSNSATGDYSIGSGSSASATLYAQKSHCSGIFGALGDAQISEVVARREITGTGLSELFLDGSSSKILIASERIYNVTINIVATTTVVGNGSGTLGDSWVSTHIVGIKNIGGTTALVGTVQTISYMADANMATAQGVITADNTTDYLKIRFLPPSTAGSTTKIRVVATVLISEVGY